MTEFEQIDDGILQLMHDASSLGIKFEITPPQELLDMQKQLFGGTTPSPKLYDLQGYYHVGSVIVQMGNPTMGELAKKLDVPLSTTTRMVTWLVDNGYVARHVDESDRRIVRIALTEKGMQLYNVATEFFARIVKQDLSMLTKEEQMILLTLLRKIVTGLLKKNQLNITDTEIK
ncbi:MAG: MarR family transcriptional regulator [Anaerolineales bacterium]|nr:MarR family transcriptional regulator [Anaerolineales bacterium]